MNYRKWTLALLFVTIFAAAQSQNIGKTKLEWNYNGTLDNVLKAIGDDYDIHFVYDSLQLQNIDVTYYAFEENTLSRLFDEWKRQWNLFSYVEKNRTVLITNKQLTHNERKESINQLIKREK
jgi:hypothetical protein